MKRGTKVFFIFLLVFILFISVVSEVNAFSLKDFFNKIVFSPGCTENNIRCHELAEGSTVYCREKCISGNWVPIYPPGGSICDICEPSGGGGGSCTDTCASLGYNCGYHTICGKNKNCGPVIRCGNDLYCGTSCTSAKKCENGKCVPITSC